MKNLISIVTPAHNEEKTIHHLLNRLLNQNGGYEVIVVNDGSTDNTARVVSEFSKKYKFIRLVNFNEGHGVSFARNQGVKRAKGRYIIFLDADHVVLPDFIEKVQMYMPFERLSLTVLSYNPKTIFQKAWSGYRLFHSKHRNEFSLGYDKKIFNKHKFNERLMFYEDEDL